MTIDQTSSYFEEKIKNSSPINRAITNQVFDTEEGTVIKKYISRPFQSAIFSALSLIIGRPVFLSWKVRKERDHRMKEILRSKDFKTPSVIREGERFLEMEKIDAENTLEFITSQGESKRIGLLVGEFLASIHQQDLAFLDANLDNFLTDGENLWSIDHEYSVLRASLIEKEIDTVMMLASALSINYRYYKGFKTGFESSYRKIGKVETVIGLIAALFISVFVRKNLDDLQNVVMNLLR